MNEEAKKSRSVLPEGMGGGPKGLGDPDDRSLRTVESDTIIHKMMREKSEELCRVQRDALSECLNNAGNLVTMLRCRAETKDLRMCQYNWFQDPNFKKEVTEQYIQLRSEYRRTGINKKRKDYMAKKEEEFLEWQRQKNKASNTQ